MKSAINYNFINFTELNSNEIHKVWMWRNDPKIRQWMYNNNEIEFESHLKFIESLKSSNEKKYWLVLRNRIPIGVNSIINIENNCGEWGYYIGSEFHDANYVVEFYYYSLGYAFECLSFKKLTGYALIENKAANSLNDLFGFTKIKVSKKISDRIMAFFYRELTYNEWIENIKTDKKIIRLLELTMNKI